MLARGWGRVAAVVVAGCDPGGSSGRADAGIDGGATRDGGTGAGREAAVDGANGATDAMHGDRPASDATGDVVGCPADAGALAAVGGTVYRTEDGNPIEGATVSVEEACFRWTRMTAPNGGYGLRLPIGETVFLRAASDETYPFIRGFVVPSIDSTQDFYVVGRLLFDMVAAAVPVTLDPAKGHVWVSFENARFAGYGAAVGATRNVPLTPTAESEYVFTRSEVTLAAGAGHWFLVFPNVEPGWTTITLDVPEGRRCVPRQRLDRWIVRPGAVTYYEADCD